MKTGKKIGIGVLVSIILVAFDQWTKWLAVTYLKGQKALELIPGVFELRYLENEGAAFGILQQKQGFFIVLTIAMLAMLAVFFVRIPSGKRYYPAHVVFVMLFAGAIGNFIDRLCYQYVVDFLYFKLINFPIFNVADCYVTVAVFAFIFLILFFYKEEELSFLGITPDKKKESDAA